MPRRAMFWLARPALLRTLVAHVRLALRLIREPRVPVLTKALPLLAMFYVAFPVDFVPDVLPVIGQLDDLAILLTALEIFVRWCPADAVAYHRVAIEQKRRYSAMPPTGVVIDAEWRRG